MTGATIDHMVSVTILIAALMVAMLTYSSMFATAVDYDRNRQVANKAIDLMNTICLSPGNPVDWGATNASLLGFGLQDPKVGGYALSPFSIMRLATGNSSGASQLVEYPRDSGIFYNYIDAGFGNSILTPLGNCVNYSDAAELLGLTDRFGFSIDIEPTLNVSVKKMLGYDHLALEVQVTGSGLPLSGAILKYYLLHITTAGSSTIIPYYGTNLTDSSGSLLLEFEDVDEETDAFQFMVYTHLNGLTGVGYYSQDDIGDYPDFIVPLISDYDQGIVILAHSFGVHDYTMTPVPSVDYNATFFGLTPDFQLQQFELENATSELVYKLNYGVSGAKSYATTQIPASEVGLLVITYKWNHKVGSVVLPWGIGTLGVHYSFVSDFGSEGYDFVATEIRQVTIDNISYQLKVSTWKLGS